MWGDLGFDAKKLYQSGQCALLVKTCGELAWGKFGQGFCKEITVMRFVFVFVFAIVCVFVFVFVSLLRENMTIIDEEPASLDDHAQHYTDGDPTRRARPQSDQETPITNN